MGTEYCSSIFIAVKVPAKELLAWIKYYPIDLYGVEDFAQKTVLAEISSKTNLTIFIGGRTEVTGASIGIAYLGCLWVGVLCNISLMCAFVITTVSHNDFTFFNLF